MKNRFSHKIGLLALAAGVVTFSVFSFVSAATTVGSNLSTTGTLSVTGNTTVGGTLGVTGATTLTGALTASANTTLGNSSLDTLTVTTGTTTFYIPAGGKLFIDGTTTDHTGTDGVLDIDVDSATTSNNIFGSNLNLNFQSTAASASGVGSYISVSKSAGSGLGVGAGLTGEFILIGGSNFDVATSYLFGSMIQNTATVTGDHNIVGYAVQFSNDEGSFNVQNDGSATGLEVTIAKSGGTGNLTSYYASLTNSGTNTSFFKGSEVSMTNSANGSSTSSFGNRIAFTNSGTSTTIYGNSVTITGNGTSTFLYGNYVSLTNTTRGQVVGMRNDIANSASLAGPTGGVYNSITYTGSSSVSQAAIPDVYGTVNDLTVSGSNTGLYGENASVYQTAGSSTAVYGNYIQMKVAANTVTTEDTTLQGVAGVRVNAVLNGGTLPNGFWVSSGGPAITDGLDVSASEIVNAINIGTNTILGSGSTTIDLLNSGYGSILTLQNSNAAQTANLLIEGGLIIGTTTTSTGGRISGHLSGVSSSFSSGNILTGSSTYLNISVPNAVVGDTVVVGVGTATPDGLMVSGNVTAAGTVRVDLHNGSTSTANIWNTVIRADVWQHATY